jgi:hypothetical protein
MVMQLPVLVSVPLLGQPSMEREERASKDSNKETIAV